MIALRVGDVVKLLGKGEPLMTVIGEVRNSRFKKDLKDKIKKYMCQWQENGHLKFGVFYSSQLLPIV
jgi:uncharacterized protein YodC (DUF2158 family)